MQISLGPLLYHWPKNKIIEFYTDVADWPVNRVYIGETVCSKRRSLTLAEWLEIGLFLSKKGKKITLSTLTLIEAQSELAFVEKLCLNNDFIVEANDMSAVYFCEKNNLSFTAGPHLNLYNSRAVDLLKKYGMQCWVLPLELSKNQFESIRKETSQLGLDPNFETEVFSYGLMPLAHSARCFTARHHGLKKDNCKFLCKIDMDGMPVFSQEGQTLFTINGVQTQSGLRLDICSEWKVMQDLGITAMRFSPHSFGTKDRLYETAHAIKMNEAAPSAATETCNGYWFGDVGMAQVPVNP